MNKRKEFSEWLTEQYQTRGWSMRQFADRAGSTIGTVSRVINQHQDPTDKFCRGVARALNTDAEIVFRRAGLLPSNPDETPQFKEGMHLFRQLPLEYQNSKIAEMRAILKMLEVERRARSIVESGREAASE